MAWLKIVIFLVLTISVNAKFFTYYQKTCSKHLTSNLFRYNLFQIMETFLNVSSSTNKSVDFYNVEINNENPAYGLFMCRGDVGPSQVCGECIYEATQQLFRECNHDSSKGVIWYDACLVRFSNSSLSMTVMEPFNWISDHNISNPNTYMHSVYTILNLTVEEAIANSSLYSKKFALKEGNLFGGQNISGLVQCINNLSPNDCRNCLHDLIRRINIWAYGRGNVIEFNPSCSLAFGLSQLLFLYNNNTASPTSHHEGQKKVSVKWIGIIVSLSIFAVMLLIFCYYCLRKRSNEKKLATPKENCGNELKLLDSLKFTIAAINIATNNFSAENIVGSGGFADVYKGVLDGCEIAVKKLKNTSAEGLVEFQNEILAKAKVQHRNLVTLLGFCLDGNQKMLIYEYVANQTLHHRLFDPLKPRVLSWPERLQIIEGIVRGVLYLHEDSRLKVIHRDLKPTNILLDNNFNPKIADFGLARIVAIGRSEQITRTIVGTNGYMAPEVLKNEISTKGDVYSLGIILLEIVRGEHNSRYARIEDITLCSIVRKMWSDNSPIELLDPEIRSTTPPSHFHKIKRCIHIALLCTQEDATKRPTMRQVASMLEKNDDLPILPTELPISDISPNIGQQNDWSVATNFSSELIPR